MGGDEKKVLAVQKKKKRKNNKKKVNYVCTRKVYFFANDFKQTCNYKIDSLNFAIGPKVNVCFCYSRHISYTRQWWSHFRNRSH